MQLRVHLYHVDSACVVYELRRFPQAGGRSLQTLAPLRVQVAVSPASTFEQDGEHAIWNTAGWFRIGGAIPGSHAGTPNYVPTPVPNLFLVTTAATHCVYSLVPIVPSVLCLRRILHSSYDI